MAKITHFVPFPGLANPHLQTVIGALASWNRDVESNHEHVLLPDGDKLSIFITTINQRFL